MRELFKRILSGTKNSQKSDQAAPKSDLHEKNAPLATPPRPHLWRSFLLWILGAALAWEVIARPIVAAWRPDILLPPPALREISILLQGLLGAGF